MMLSNSGFLFAFRGQNNPLKPKISWKIFNLRAFVRLLSRAKLSQIASKNIANLTLGCRKKNHK